MTDRPGFTRVLRLFGEFGEVGFAFHRDDGFGFTLVGDDAVAALEVARMEPEMDRIDREQRDSFVDAFGKGNLYVSSSYPVQTTGYRVWDDLGRAPEFRGGGAVLATSPPGAAGTCLTARC